MWSLLRPMNWRKAKDSHEEIVPEEKLYNYWKCLFQLRRLNKLTFHSKNKHSEKSQIYEGVNLVIQKTWLLQEKMNSYLTGFKKILQ